MTHENNLINQSESSRTIEKNRNVNKLKVQREASPNNCLEKFKCEQIQTERITITASSNQSVPKFFPLMRIGRSHGSHQKYKEESGNTTVGGKKAG